MIASDRTTWMARARCKGEPDEVFFPGRGESSDVAKAICRGCPVRVECLEHALANGEHFGIWGGTSERERKRIWRTRKAAA